MPLVTLRFAVVKVPATATLALHVRSPGTVKLLAVEAPSGICVYPTLGGVNVSVLLIMVCVKLLKTILWISAAWWETDCTWIFGGWSV